MKSLLEILTGIMVLANIMCLITGYLFYYNAYYNIDNNGDWVPKFMFKIGLASYTIITAWLSFDFLYLILVT